MVTTGLTTALQSVLGYTFATPALLDRALVHRSWAHDQSPVVPDNERLEFLGDAVLGLVIAEFFVREFPDVDEGRLTRAREMLVRAESLSKHARELGLGDHLRLSKGEIDQGGRDRDSVLSDGFEAVLGAIYRDGGLEAARSFVLRTMSEDLSRRDRDGGPHSPRNPRNVLQERLQQQRRGVPHYEILSRTGPDHRPAFAAQVSIGSDVLAQGEGPSKREAFEDAALKALSASENSR